MPALKSVHPMSLCVLVLAGMAIHQAIRAPSIGAEGFGSGTAPMAVAVALIVLAIAMIFEGESDDDPAAETNAEPKPAADAESPVVKGALLAVTLIVYVALLEVTDLSFWILSLIFLAVAARIIEGQLRKWLLLSLATSAFLAIAIEVVFTQFLHIDLP